MRDEEGHIVILSILIFRGQLLKQVVEGKEKDLEELFQSSFSEDNFWNTYTNETTQKKITTFNPHFPRTTSETSSADSLILIYYAFNPHFPRTTSETAK